MESSPTPVAVLLVGPPGSGKSTFCEAAAMVLGALGREVAVVNLDPGEPRPGRAGAVPSSAPGQGGGGGGGRERRVPDVDVRELITVEEAMEAEGLGPNGALLYCMEHVAANLDWLEERVRPLRRRGAFVLVDLPGQVELFTHHPSLREIIAAVRRWRLDPVSVNFIDSFLCQDADKYVSALLLSLNVMCALELPHVNLLSKADLARDAAAAGGGRVPAEFYAEEGALEAIVQRKREEGDSEAHVRLTEAVIGLVEDYSMVCFTPVTVTERDSLMGAVDLIDKAAGFVQGAPERGAREQLLRMPGGGARAAAEAWRNAATGGV